MGPSLEKVRNMSFGRARDKLAAALSFYDSKVGRGLSADLCSRRAPNGDLIMSNFEVRRLQRKAFERVAVPLVLSLLRKPHIRFFFFTFIPGSASTPMDRPELNIARLMLQASRVLEKLGLEGLYTLEIDVVAKRERDKDSALLLPHVHGIVWSEDPGFKPRKAAKAISSLPAYQDSYGVPAVTLKSRKQARVQRENAIKRSGKGKVPKWLSEHPHLDQTKRSVRRLVEYMTKPATHAKNIYRVDDKLFVWDDAGSFTHQKAIRMAEFWSHITAHQMVRARGAEARLARGEYRNALRLPARTGRAKRRALTLNRADTLAQWKAYFHQVPELKLKRSVVRHRKK